MRFKKYLLGALAFTSAFLFAVNAFAARTDMVDVSKYNNSGNPVTTSQFTTMRNNYGVKVATVRVSAGTNYVDPNAKQNIADAQSAGLYVNGYEYAHFNSVDSAKAEAQYAVNAAKNAGLPVTSVLVADVESNYYQGSLSKSTLDAAYSAWASVVKAGGYRPDLYTMGSWVYSKVSVANGTGWIAQYPYHVSTDHWTGNNGWQFSSKQTFGLSAGYFDVSQLYTNYYTAGTDKNAVISNSNTANVSTVKNNSKAKMSAKGSASSTKLAVDGYLGYKTILRSQQVYSMRVQDGVLSKPKSSMVLVWQRHLGVTADGILGPRTINAMERRAGLKHTDGKLSSPSYTVKYMQRQLNKGLKPF